MKLPLMKNRACLALAEEMETARAAFYRLLDRFPPEVLAEGNPETEDNVRGIVCHVNRAAFSYGCWIDRVLGRLDTGTEAERKDGFWTRVLSARTAAELRESGEEGAANLYAAMSGVSEDELGREFRTNWGETMAVETMMEHALVHYMRHRRQLEIHLGDRPRGETAVGA